MKETEEKPVLRENFGPGEVGETAYLTILQGTICEVILTENDKCIKISDRTVGFDVFSNNNFVAVCGVEHEELTKRRLTEDLAKAGQIPSFDRNGFGRS